MGLYNIVSVTFLIQIEQIFNAMLVCYASSYKRLNSLLQSFLFIICSEADYKNITNYPQ